MIFNENENDNDNAQKDEENPDMIKISQNIEEVKYIIKIYKSKDHSTIVFKAEQENIQTFYFYEKFDLMDFKQKNKDFVQFENIDAAFNTLKIIIEASSTKIEKKSLIMNISFINDSKIVTLFSLRKKIVSQNRLNPLLVEQIQNNKSKIKALKKQVIKLDKSTKNQNELINNLNNKIDDIKNKINDIISSINNINEAVSNSIKNEENSNEEKTNKISNINKKMNNYIKNNSNEKKEKVSENNAIDLNEKENNSLNENKKKEGGVMYNIPLILNIFIFIFIAYLYLYFYELKKELNFEKNKKEKIRNKYSILDFADDLTDDEIKYIELNIDKLNEEEKNIKKKQSYNLINNLKKNKRKKNKGNISKKQKNNIPNSKEINQNIDILKEKNNEMELSKEIKNEKNNKNKNNNKNIIKEDIKINISNENYLLENENLSKYFKKKIKQKAKYKIKDIKFVLKYKSNSKENNNFYRDCRGISQNLILIKTNEGKKIGLFSKNIIDIIKNIKSTNFEINDNDFIGYIVDSQNIEEIFFQDFFDVYNSFISIFKDISNFMNNENDNYAKNNIGKINTIEIYQIKYIIK